MRIKVELVTNVTRKSLLLRGIHGYNVRRCLIQLPPQKKVQLHVLRLIELENGNRPHRQTKKNNKQNAMLRSERIPNRSTVLLPGVSVYD